MLYWPLMAHADIGQAFSRYSRRSGSFSDNWYLLALFLVIPALWVALHYWDKYRKQFAVTGNNPRSLFLELCRAHKLSRAERSLLLKAAEGRQLRQPALVFIDPVILGDLAESSDDDAPFYAQLAKKVFGVVGVPEAV